MCKDSSTNTKFLVVFNVSARSSMGVSLNNQLLVGPTVHAPLIDALIRFRRYPLAITTHTCISRMCRAIFLLETQCDLYHFVRRRNEHDTWKDYRTTRLTFGVSASSFAADMAVKCDVMLHKKSHSRAALAIHDSFYVDDGLTGTNSISETISLQTKLQELFDRGCFLLRKWRSNEPTVLRHLPPHLVDQSSSCKLPVNLN